MPNMTMHSLTSIVAFQCIIIKKPFLRCLCLKFRQLSRQFVQGAYTLDTWSTWLSMEPISKLWTPASITCLSMELKSCCNQTCITKAFTDRCDLTRMIDICALLDYLSPPCDTFPGLSIRSYTSESASWAWGLYFIFTQEKLLHRQ